MPESFKWQFPARFRRRAFGWKSQPAIQRVKEAVSEIKAVARRDPLLAAEGAVLFLEKLSPALEQVDSSSGAIGTAVNKAIETLVPLIARAPADARTREAWLERLWEAYQADQMPYIERLGEHWGALCASPELASHWADELIGTVRMAWSPDPGLRGFFPGAVNCLSALFHAERHEELLELLARAPYPFWPDRRWGVRALVARGRKAEALRYAEASRGCNTSPVAIARACEEILLSSGMADEAYARYAIEANQANSYAATFRAIAKKYPGKQPAEILRDLVASTPGSEGKWFAAAKDAGLLDEAIALAKQSPCDPRTLTRAARDFAEENPGFALEAGLAALHWLVLGYGYDVTSADVWSAYDHTRKAAERLGRSDETRARIRALVAGETFDDRFVSKVLGAELEEGGKR
ncbi:MAG: hypothetical protein P1P84_25240 [Deferrisomatales bacterium]|nr:hypothetical protein [Deferrisomatales bacterium]